MQDFKTRFITLCLSKRMITFGDFTLKSGRQSPYFYNSGQIHTGSALAEIGAHYAAAAIHSDVTFDGLFGPAYKGIPLAAAMSIGLAMEFGRDVPFTFNRKELKNHGDAGGFVGAPLKGRVLIVDDVISKGMAKREAIDLIRSEGAEPAGIVISLDREERGEGRLSAAQEMEKEFGLPVISIITLSDLIIDLDTRPEFAEEVSALRAYRSRYGAPQRAGQLLS